MFVKGVLRIIKIFSFFFSRSSAFLFSHTDSFYFILKKGSTIARKKPFTENSRAKICKVAQETWV